MDHAAGQAKLAEWIGRTESAEDTANPWPVAALRAVLDGGAASDRGDELPPGGHWLYFLKAAPASQLGPDGHPKVGGFLPAVALPWRMWAGGRLTFHRPVRVGERLRRVSEIIAVKERTGRSGPLVFVTVRHTIGSDAGAAITEEHDIVYRGGPAFEPQPPEPAPASATWARELVPDAVLLFRYSALTFNGHRIHYDADYCRDDCGYPGLVVHGPLIATLLMDLAQRAKPDMRLATFGFRAVRPLFAGRPMTLNARAEGNGLALWAADDAGALAMRAEATLAAR